jgi:hypothetical protein
MNPQEIAELKRQLAQAQRDRTAALKRVDDERRRHEEVLKASERDKGFTQSQVQAAQAGVDSRVAAARLEVENQFKDRISGFEAKLQTVSNAHAEEVRTLGARHESQVSNLQKQLESIPRQRQQDQFDRERVSSRVAGMAPWAAAGAVVSGAVTVNQYRKNVAAARGVEKLADEVKVMVASSKGRVLDGASRARLASKVETAYALGGAKAGLPLGGRTVSDKNLSHASRRNPEFFSKMPHGGKLAVGGLAFMGATYGLTRFGNEDWRRVGDTMTLNEMYAGVAYGMVHKLSGGFVKPDVDAAKVSEVRGARRLLLEQSRAFRQLGIDKKLPVEGIASIGRHQVTKDVLSSLNPKDATHRFPVGGVDTSTGLRWNKNMQAPRLNARIEAVRAAQSGYFGGVTKLLASPAAKVGGGVGAMMLIGGLIARAAIGAEKPKLDAGDDGSDKKGWMARTRQVKITKEARYAPTPRAGNDSRH